ncbi:unnamed protein product [Lathyrus sativus]|nr:unnamed protein product [Lathyrus sativus]
MHDGAVRTEVWHVPDMSKNLISLTTLDLGGCKFVFGDGVLKVVKGALIMTKAHQTGRFYVLQGSTITSTTVVSSSMSDSYETILWHMSLGHISEKGLAMLSKRGLLSSQSTSKLEFYDFNKLCKDEGIVRHLTVKRYSETE